MAKAEPGTVGLPSGAAGPFPDDLGGGDRGRFLRNRKIWSGLHFYSSSINTDTIKINVFIINYKKKVNVRQECAINHCIT